MHLLKLHRTHRLTRFWEAWTLSKDANNLLAMARTWQHADIGAQPLYQGPSASATPQDQGGRLGIRGAGGELGEEDDEAFARALKGITAKTLIMPASTDVSQDRSVSSLEISRLTLVFLDVLSACRLSQ